MIFLMEVVNEMIFLGRYLMDYERNSLWYYLESFLNELDLRSNLMYLELKVL
jgi:hypothetical protein